MTIFRLVIFLLQIVIGGVRWASVLAGLGTKIRQGLLVRLFYVGVFFNQALPGGSGGDAVRMYLSYKHGLSLRNAVNGVIIERIATVLALVALVDITQLLFVRELSHDMRNFSIIGATLCKKHGNPGNSSIFLNFSAFGISPGSDKGPFARFQFGSRQKKQ